jgi:hypothetical protein
MVLAVAGEHAAYSKYRQPFKHSAFVLDEDDDSNRAGARGQSASQRRNRIRGGRSRQLGHRTGLGTTLATHTTNNASQPTTSKSSNNKGPIQL